MDFLEWCSDNVDILFMFWLCLTPILAGVGILIYNLAKLFSGCGG